MHLHHVLALAAASLAAVVNAQQPPQFDPRRSSDFLSPSLSEWNVGSPTRLTAMDADKEPDKRIRVELKGGNCTDRRTTFVYKCTRDAGFKETSLSNYSAYRTVALCGKEQPLPLDITNLNTRKTKYLLKIKNPQLKSASYLRAFEDKVELKVKVDCREATLVSNSLFVMNWDSLSQINTAYITRDFLQSFTRRFLTEDAVKFMARMNMPSTEFSSLDFIDPLIVDLIRNSPDLFKSKIGVGAVVPIGGELGYKGNAFMRQSLYFGSVQKPMSNQNYEMMKFVHLDVDTGKLHYSTYGLSKAISDFVKARNSKNMALYTRIGVSTDDTLGSLVKKSFHIDGNFYRQHGSHNSNCILAATSNSKSVSLFSGVHKSSLTCPIVCSDGATLFTFRRKGRSIYHEGYEEFHESVAGLEIHRNGKILKFPSILTPSHSGVYSCHARDVSFQFNVSAVSLPHFNEDTGTLPKSVFAVEGETMSYSCTASFTNIGSVTVTPQFYTSYPVGNSGKWRRADIYQFNRILSWYGGKPVTSRVYGSDGSQTLTMTVTSVTRELSHRFACSASVTEEAKIGLPHYTVESSSNVYFIPRPSKSSFVISAEPACGGVRLPCSSGNLSVKLSANLSQYLRSIGVQVRAHFVLLSNSSQQHLPLNDDIINSAFHAETNSLTADIAFGDKDVNWLQRYAYLAPVFQFWYATGDEGGLGRLRLGKSKYGVSHQVLSCLHRDSSRCFYSTEFDAYGSLASLGFHIGVGRGWQD